MGLRTLLLYLIGNRQAILTLAANRWTVWLGAVFVLSAGLAREYDGADLLHEPWWLLIPFGASIGASFFLAMLASSAVRDFAWYKYRCFLGLFWMTAPLAWLYAIPFERFLDPVSAMQANVYVLGLVATWR